MTTTGGTSNDGGTSPRGGRATSSERRAPQVPSWLQGEARAEWRRVVPVLKALGYLETTDVTLVALYCDAFGHWRALQEELGQAETHVAHCRECDAVVVVSKYLVEGARHNLVKTPLWQMTRDAAVAVERLAGQLGLTPGARQRMPPPPPPPDASKDPLSGFAGGDRAGGGEFDDDEERFEGEDE